MLLQGRLVRLRAYTKDDLEPARTLINETEVGAGLRPGILFPMRPEDELKWYEKLDPMSATEYSWAIERIDDAQYLGGCGVFRIDPKNRFGLVGIFLGKEYWGQGLGSDALRILVDFCFLEANLNKVRLDVFSFNERAIRCYEKVGFVREGALRAEMFRDGRYHDVIPMGILRSEWEAARDEA